MWKYVIQSAWWIVFYLDKDKIPSYLLIKRRALSWKIERVCPKWKLESWESPKQAAIREVWEETWLDTKHLRVYNKLGITKLRNTTASRWMMNKDTTYYLMEYKWDITDVTVEDGWGFIWIHKWATFENVLWLVYYQDIRELIRIWHQEVLELISKNQIR